MMNYIIKTCIYLLALLLCTQGYSQDSGTLKRSADSLNKLAIQAPDTTKADLFNKIGWSYRNANPDTTIAYAQKAFDIANKKKYNKAKITSLNYIGIAYRNKGSYSLALRYYFDALKAAEKAKLKEQIGYSYINIGNIHIYQNNHQEAVKHFNKALITAQSLQNKGMIAYCYLNLGRSFRKHKEYKEAEKYFSKTLTIRRELKDLPGILILEVDIAEIYRLQKDYDKSLTHFLKTIESAQKINNQGALAYIFNNIARIYKVTNKPDKAEDYAQKSLGISKKRGLHNDVQKALANLAEIYEKKGSFEKAYQHHLRFVHVKDSLFNAANTRKISRLHSRYETEKRETQVTLERKIHKAESKRKALVLYSVIGGLIFISLLAFVLFINNRQKNKLNLLLSQRNNKLAEQQREISHKNVILEDQKSDLNTKSNALEKTNTNITRKNQDIIASMNYAKRIQNAMLPLKSEINKILPNYFILYKPRDIVSGDFYWFAKIESRVSQKVYSRRAESPVVDSDFQGVAPDIEGSSNTENDLFPLVDAELDKAIIAAVDCTGHGVPGAFMSLVGNEILNEIIIVKGITQPARILEELQQGIRQALHQRETKNKDGMDIAICTIDMIPEHLKNTSYIPKLQFAGAGNPLIYMQNDELHIIKSTRTSIGGYHNLNLNIPDDFTNHTVSLEQPTTFYIFSDGYHSSFAPFFLK